MAVFCFSDNYELKKDLRHFYKNNIHELIYLLQDRLIITKERSEYNLILLRSNWQNDIL